jgi:alcohol dehydrogenase
MACGDPKAAARIAILDPALTVSQPARVTACSGIDAIAHALETAVTTKRTPLSLLFSREALRLTLAGLPRVLENPNDLEARGQMLLGAAWAGTAIENSMLGAAHAAANPLTAHFGIVHGHAVGLMLPHVIRFNAADPAIARAYADALPSPVLRSLVEGGSSPVFRSFSEGGSSNSIQPEPSHNSSPSPEALAATIEHLLDLARLPRSLAALGISAEKIPELASEATSQWTAQFNPRPLTADDFESLYRDATGGFR